MVERREGRGQALRASAAPDDELPRLGRRERNKQEKLARIVGAAKQLFGSKGFAETTTQEIAERADIGTGTLFLYAKSKEDLLVMVFRDEMIETSQAAFSNMPPTASLVDQLMHVFGMMIAYHDRDAELARILLKEIMFPASPERREDIPTLMRVIYSGIADLRPGRAGVGRIAREGRSAAGRRKPVRHLLLQPDLLARRLHLEAAAYRPPARQADDGGRGPGRTQDQGLVDRARLC